MRIDKIYILIFLLIVILNPYNAISKQTNDTKNIELTVEADNSLEWFEKEKYYIAKGNVIIENKAKGRKSKADLGVYNSNDEIIRLTGNVVIINQKSKLSGSKGITNLKTGVSNIIGDPKNKKRVQGTFSPIKKQKKGD